MCGASLETHGEPWLFEGRKVKALFIGCDLRKSGWPTLQFHPRAIQRRMYYSRMESDILDMLLDHQQDQDTTDRGHISPDSCCLDNSASHYPTQIHPDLNGSSPYGSCHQQQGLNHPHSVSYNNSFETESDTSYVSSSTSPSAAFMDPYESATSEEQFHTAHNQSYYCHSLPSNRSEKVVT